MRPIDRLVAHALHHYDAEGVLRLDETTLAVTVRPRTVEVWEWWLRRYRVPTTAVTYRGGAATARGMRDGVRVHLIGIGVGQLITARLEADRG